MKIFILDPDSNRQRQLKTILTSLGHKTGEMTSTTDNKSGMTALRKLPFNLAFIVVGIKEFDTMDFIYELRGAAIFQSLPIIIYGPLLTKSTILSAHEAGTNGFLAYPFALSDVEEVIKKVTGNKK